MISKEEVLKLAVLSRISITDDEANNLLKDMEGILSYIGQLGEVKVESAKSKAEDLRNVMREDINPHQASTFTEAILKEAPKKKGDFVEVKKIL
jgi:aspartyl-tRNA(Asn)/glutamyl-tRNA(Gln) amidotransferase subunit C